MTVKTLKSYYYNGTIKKVEYTSLTSDVEKLFDSAVFDAELLAKLQNGKIYTQRTKKTLYVGYLDIPNTDLIDIVRIAI